MIIIELLLFTGNISNYFQYRFKAQEVPAKEGVHWHYNFHQVTWSATIVFAYATIVPSGLFGALWSNTPKDSQFKPSWIELVCIFGYCLAPFVPASVLWLIQISLGKRHAFKRYAQFVLNISCFCGKNCLVGYY